MQKHVFIPVLLFYHDAMLHEASIPKKMSCFHSELVAANSFPTASIVVFPPVKTTSTFHSPGPNNDRNSSSNYTAAAPTRRDDCIQSALSARQRPDGSSNSSASVPWPSTTFSSSYEETNVAPVHTMMFSTTTWHSGQPKLTCPCVAAILDGMLMFGMTMYAGMP